GEGDGNGSAAGTLHNHVNEVLRERIECNASRIQTAILALIPTAALAGNIPQCRQPIQRVVLLSLRPLSDDVDQVAQVLPGALLIEVKRGLSLIAFANQRPSFVGCFLRSACLRDWEGVQLRLSVAYGIF